MSSEIFNKCKGYTLKLTHPAIKEDHEYQIHAYRRLEGEYGDFFMLYCSLPEIEQYQRVFSNTYLTKNLIDYCCILTTYEPNEEGVMVWNGDKSRIAKFYPGSIAYYNNNRYRKVIFDISSC